MDEVAELTEAFTECCQRVLSSNGRLSTAIPGFVARDEQIQLAGQIAEAIQQQSTLVAEAGTGTGKTFAYLVPCLLSGKKALVSTATKTLQDQLFHKDLPTLTRALGRVLRVENLKGRANYFCRYRVQLHAEEGRFIEPKHAHEILFVRDKLSQLEVGERGELPEIKEDSAIWPYVTSTADNCLGSECAHHATCFLVKARRRALEADVVVINHHLYFADSRLKEEGVGELLPGVSTVIFDEAHQIPDIAANFQGIRISTRQSMDLMDDVLREWPVLDLPNQPLRELKQTLAQVIDGLLQATVRHEERFTWDRVQKNASFIAAWEQFLGWFEQMLACFHEKLEDNQAGLRRCKERLTELHQGLQAFVQPELQSIRWVERFKQSLVLNMTPVDVAKGMQEILARQSCAYIFTSATLTMAESFEAFTRPLGLTQASTLLLPSPFNYKQQALLYLPRALPDPKNPQFHEKLLDKVLPIIRACGGRCFFLFTSHRALQEVASLLRGQLEFPLLVQGEEAKPILLARFRQLGNAVLLGTATFWEGVDVKGDALSCVIIDKLPFASPSDPVVQGKMAHLKKQGLSAFDVLSLPNAVLALKQGVGRLIRDASDKGVLVIADPRLTARAYGRVIFDSLPDMVKTRCEQTVLAFINQLALTHESFSD